MTAHCLSLPLCHPEQAGRYPDHHQWSRSLRRKRLV